MIDAYHIDQGKYEQFPASIVLHNPLVFYAFDERVCYLG
jgi:hypothetical protein